MAFSTRADPVGVTVHIPYLEKRTRVINNMLVRVGHDAWYTTPANHSEDEDDEDTDRSARTQAQAPVDDDSTDTDTEIWRAVYRTLSPVQGAEGVVSIARIHIRHIWG